MASGLSKIEVITNFTKFAELQSELGHLGVRGMTVSQVLGCGIQKGSAEYAIEENEEIVLLPKQMITLVVETEKVHDIVEVVKQTLYTGHIGDGKIFVSSLDNVIKVRTGDEGVDAL